tara:strand:+ start:419 stop:952 length:534 start_codon:yes stop_codon:yes gene_type:complete
MAFADDLFNQLQGYGIYEYLLPFLLVFSLTFAILEKVKILGQDKKNINVIVSLIIGLLFVTQTSLVSTLNIFLPKISLFIIVAVMALILFGIFGAKVHEGLGSVGLLIAAIISIIAIYWGLSPSLGFELPYWVQDNWGVILVLIVVIIVIALVTGGDSKGKGTKMTIDDMVGKIFKN